MAKNFSSRKKELTSELMRLWTTTGERARTLVEKVKQLVEEVKELDLPQYSYPTPSKEMLDGIPEVKFFTIGNAEAARAYLADKTEKELTLLLAEIDQLTFNKDFRELYEMKCDLAYIIRRKRSGWKKVEGAIYAPCKSLYVIPKKTPKIPSD